MTNTHQSEHGSCPKDGQKSDMNKSLDSSSEKVCEGIIPRAFRQLREIKEAHWRAKVIKDRTQGVIWEGPYPDRWFTEAKEKDRALKRVGMRPRVIGPVVLVLSLAVNWMSWTEFCKHHADQTVTHTMGSFLGACETTSTQRKEFVDIMREGLTHVWSGLCPKPREQGRPGPGKDLNNYQSIRLIFSRQQRPLQVKQTVSGVSNHRA